MRQFVVSVGSAVAARTPEELIGAILLALGVSLAVAGLYALRRGKAADLPPLLVGLMLVGNVGSMIFAAAWLDVARTAPAMSTRPSNIIGPPPGWHPGPAAPGHMIFHAADADGDGQLTPAEAARFAQIADLNGKGWADVQEVERAAWNRHGPPHGPEQARPGPGPGGTPP